MNSYKLLNNQDDQFDNESDIRRTIFIELDKIMSESYFKLLPALMGWDDNTSVKFVKVSHNNSNNVGHGFITFNDEQKASKVLAYFKSNPLMPGSVRPFKGDWAINAPHLLGNPFTSALSKSSTPIDKFNEFSIFVGDLSPDASESDLLKAFQNPPNLSQPFTSCTNVKIMTDYTTGSSRCFGFVRFSNEKDMERAVDEMQGIPVAGRPIRVSTATPKIKINNQSHIQQPNNHLHNIHQHPLTIQPQPQLYPNIAESNMVRLDEIAVEAERRNQRQRDIQAQLQADHINRLANMSTPNSTNQHAFPTSTASHIANAAVANATSDPHNTTVFVGGLSSLISEDTLRVFFSPFGAITYVKIPPGKGCGFVQFVRKADAERAIERMQGFPIGGGRIRLSWGRSQSDKAAQAAAQAAQLGLGIGALGQMANLTPAQAIQLSTALQNLGNSGVTNTSVHNAIRHLATATSTLRQNGNQPSATSTPPSLNLPLPHLQPLQPPLHPQQTANASTSNNFNQNLEFQMQLLQSQNEINKLRQNASLTNSPSNINNLTNPILNNHNIQQNQQHQHQQQHTQARMDPIFYLPPDKSAYPDYNAMERERNLFRSFMKTTNNDHQASSSSTNNSPTSVTTNSFKTPTSNSSTSFTETQPHQSPRMPTNMNNNSLENFFRAKEIDHHNYHHQFGKDISNNNNLDQILSRDLSGLNLRPVVKQQLPQSTSPLNASLSLNENKNNSNNNSNISNQGVKDIWN